MSCFLEYIDPLSKILKNLLYGSSGISGPRFFQLVKHMDFGNFDMYKNTICFIVLNDLGVFLNVLSSPGVSEDTNSLLCGSWTRPKIPKS